MRQSDRRPSNRIQINKRFLGLSGYRTATNANNIYQFIGGLNGVLGETMTWDVYASHGQTLNTYSSTGAARFSVVQQLLNAPDGGASLCAGGFNPFGNQSGFGGLQHLGGAGILRPHQCHAGHVERRHAGHRLRAARRAT